MKNTKKKKKKKKKTRNKIQHIELQTQCTKPPSSSSSPEEDKRTHTFHVSSSHSFIESCSRMSPLRVVFSCSSFVQSTMNSGVLGKGKAKYDGEYGYLWSLSGLYYVFFFSSSSSFLVLFLFLFLTSFSGFVFFSPFLISSSSSFSSRSS